MIKTALDIRGIIIIVAILSMLILAAVNRESRAGETFAVGEVDILIDNESYYNGEVSTSTSWDLRDLTIERFFDFNDVKPDDYGEDTISIHVELEDSYLCADVTLTSNNENGCTEPESHEDATCGNPGIAEGELASLMQFMWWADDGDNVLEDDETVISQGPIGLLTLDTPLTLALADTDTNIWTGVGGPVLEDETRYIGKAWCYGELTPQPLTQDGVNNVRNPSLNNDGLGDAGEPADGGFLCDGTLLGNESQGDSLTADVSFNAVHVFGNEGYLCSDGEPPEGEGGEEGLFNDDFGMGETDTTFDESPVWEEGGTFGAEKRAPSSGEDAASPAGGRMGVMLGPDGWICKSLDGSDFNSIEIFYFWRGDDDATAGDVGLVQYATGGTCAAPTGLTSVESHDLTDAVWHINSADFSAVDSSTFLLFFRADTANSNVDFRIDGVEFLGLPN